jgi:hypothetical protein
VRKHGYLAAAGLAVALTACDAGGGSEAAAESTAADVTTSVGNETPATVRSVPTTGGPTTSTTTTTSTTSMSEAMSGRLDTLPRADPVTFAARDGVTWPVPDIVPNTHVLHMARESVLGDRVLRQLTYVRADCDGLDDYYDGSYSVPDCEQTVSVVADDAFDVERSSLPGPTIPVTPDGDINMLDEVSLIFDNLELYGADEAQIEMERGCFEDPDCAPMTTYLERRLGEANVTVDASDIDINRLVLLAKTIREVDESELPLLPVGIDDGDFGPVVASTTDGGHELRARSGAFVELMLDDVVERRHVVRASPDNPVVGNYETASGVLVFFGMTEPNVAEVVVEFDNGDEPIAVATGDLTGTFRHQFFIIELPRRTTREGAAMLARDVDGNGLATYSVSMESGISRLDPVE